MQKFEIEIEGVTPYMQHRMDDTSLEEWEKRKGTIGSRKDINDADVKRAMYYSYHDEKIGHYIPSEHIKGALIGAGAMIKSSVGNSRKSMKNIVAGMFFIEEDKLPLKNEFVIDKRSAVNRNIKGRVISIRPKWEEWKIKFSLMVDNDHIPKETIQAIVEHAGNFIGIGSFRPSNNGMYGRFKIKKLQKMAS